MGSSWGRGQGWGPGQGSRSGEGSRFLVKVVVKVGGQCQRSRSWGQGQGHDWWSLNRRSRSVVKVRE